MRFFLTTIPSPTSPTSHAHHRIHVHSRHRPCIHIRYYETQPQQTKFNNQSHPTSNLRSKSKAQSEPPPQQQPHVKKSISDSRNTQEKKETNNNNNNRNNNHLRNDGQKREKAKKIVQQQQHPTPSLISRVMYSINRAISSPQSDSKIDEYENNNNRKNKSSSNKRSTADVDEAEEGEGEEEGEDQQHPQKPTGTFSSLQQKLNFKFKRYPKEADPRVIEMTKKISACIKYKVK